MKMLNYFHRICDQFWESRTLQASVGFHFWAVGVIFTYPRVAFAEPGSFADQMMHFDVVSVLWAFATGLLGGFGRTLISLMSDEIIVASIWKEALKDAVVSLIAGAVAYFALEAVRAIYWPELPGAVRFAVILFAGASRLSFFGLVNRLAVRFFEGWADKLGAAGKDLAAGETRGLRREAKERGETDSVNHIPVSKEVAIRAQAGPPIDQAAAVAATGSTQHVA